MCPSVLVFPSYFNAKVLYQVTVVKCVIVCPKIILDAGFFEDMKLQFSGLHVHLI
jgi:hypothetical protein